MTHRNYKWELLGLLCLAFFFHQKQPDTKDPWQNPLSMLGIIFRKPTALGKESSPEDIGEGAAFLSSAKAGNITGSSLLVSGGIDIQLVPPDCAV